MRPDGPETLIAPKIFLPPENTGAAMHRIPVSHSSSSTVNPCIWIDFISSCRRSNSIIVLGVLAGKPSALRKLLGRNKVDLLFTDPPYNCSYSSGNRPLPEKARPKQSRQWEKIYSDNLTQEQYIKWLGIVLRNVSKYLAAGAPIYIWNGHRQFGPMHQLLESIGIY